MAIDFDSLISNENKVELIKQRLGQFIGEAYQLTLNKRTAEQLGKADQTEAIDENLRLLEVAIKVHQDELVKVSTGSLEV